MKDKKELASTSTNQSWIQPQSQKWINNHWWINDGSTMDQRWIDDWTNGCDGFQVCNIQVLINILQAVCVLFKIRLIDSVLDPLTFFYWRLILCLNYYLSLLNPEDCLFLFVVFKKWWCTWEWIMLTRRIKSRQKYDLYTQACSVRTRQRLIRHEPAHWQRINRE